MNKRCEKCGCAPCAGEFVGCPESPDWEASNPGLFATELTAANMHESLMRRVPPGFLAQVTGLAQITGQTAEEMAEEWLVELVAEMRSFLASVDHEAALRGISPERLFARMCLHGTMGEL